MAAPSTLALIAANFKEGQTRNKAVAIFAGVSAGPVRWVSSWEACL
jgi:hypothetical protein